MAHPGGGTADGGGGDAWAGGTAGGHGSHGPDDVISLLEQQALQQPVLQLPAQQLLHTSPSPGALAATDAPAATAHASAGGGGGRLVTWSRLADMPFELMYRELAAFSVRFGSCHVPRHCFDAPQLGAWTRWLRHQRARKLLPQWQVDRWARRGARVGFGAGLVAPRAGRGCGRALPAPLNPSVYVNMHTAAHPYTH